MPLIDSPISSHNPKLMISDVMCEQNNTITHLSHSHWNENFWDHQDSLHRFIFQNNINKFIKHQRKVENVNNLRLRLRIQICYDIIHFVRDSFASSVGNLILAYFCKTEFFQNKFHNLRSA